MEQRSQMLKQMQLSKTEREREVTYFHLHLFFCYRRTVYNYVEPNEVMRICQGSLLHSLLTIFGLFAPWRPPDSKHHRRITDFHQEEAGETVAQQVTCTNHSCERGGSAGVYLSKIVFIISLLNAYFLFTCEA